MTTQQQSNPNILTNIPPEIIHRIFWRLPINIICCSKTVCKGWNALLSSAEFWAHHPVFNPNHSWLMFCIHYPTVENILYALSTNTWKIISMTFMPHYRTGLTYYASCSGIVLVGLGGYPQTLFVCNPLMRQFWQLSPTLSIKFNSFTAMRIVFGEDKVYYKVVAIAPDQHRNKNVVEIYNFSNCSWKTAGKIPQEFTLRNEIEICKSSIFCLAYHPKDLMVYCSIKEDVFEVMKCMKLPLPNLHGSVHYSLLALGASILLTTTIKDVNLKSDIRIWEFQGIDHNDEDSSAYSNSPWKEIARMPEPMCE